MTIRSSDDHKIPPGHADTLLQSIDISVRMLRNTALTIALSVSALAIAATGSMAAEAHAGSSASQQAKRPFEISVDGVPVAGASAVDDAGAPAADMADEVDVKVKFDGLDARPILNVSTVPPRRSFAAGEQIGFLASTNYPDWIARMELRILSDDGGSADEPLGIVEVAPYGRAYWTMPEDGPDRMRYVLRVYDADGAFDETVPLSLLRNAETLTSHGTDDTPAAGTGEDRTAFRNISIHGGAVTVYGSNIPSDHHVTVFGSAVPVDPAGRFVTQRILPPGEHDVDIDVADRNGEGLSFGRSVNIPDNDWFYVGMADLTAGQRMGSKGIEAVKPGEFDNLYTRGRAAFYLKGKIKGRYLLTASADTREGPLDEIFKGLDGKDARQFLRRIDPDSYYPVYGADSSTVEDAPTRGKFYVRLERGDSHVMWGNFKANITGTEFLRNDRALYGASLAYRPAPATSFGARRTDLQAYASQPGTLPQRDMLRGTGGSAYFLKQQDITRGSETITVEVHDKVSGRVIDRRTLQYGIDYDINYVQGVLLLMKPLGSAASNNDAVESGGNPVYVLADYEFTPASGDVDGYTFGGRAQQWLGENIRLGATGMTEKTGSADQKLAGADILLRHSEGTYLEAEAAQSQGPGIGGAYSQNGGLDIRDIPDAGMKGRTANAYRVRGRADLGELTAGEFTGSLEAYAQAYEAGFSSRERSVAEGEAGWGLLGTIGTDETGSLTSRYDERRVDGGGASREAVVQSEISLGENWSVTPGVNLSDIQDTDGDNGSRVDGGARLTYSWSAERLAYLRAQGTFDRTGNRDRNDRVGIGGKTPLTDKLSIGGEISIGTSGPGAEATIDYAPSADDHYYAGYRLDPSTEYVTSGISPLDDELGVIVAGARRQLNEHVSGFAETRSAPWGEAPSLVQAYGVTYTPDSHWTLTGGLESGLIFGDSTVEDTSDIQRNAISAHVSYANTEQFRVKGGAEFRNDDEKDGSADIQSYLLTGEMRVAVSDDWRFIAHADAVFTDASETTRDGDYVEASAGFAYRPAGNDKFNALFRYTYLYDLPGADQVTFNGTMEGPQQQSHILSVDASYDLVPQLTIGSKYGVRQSSTRERDGTGSWHDSIAQIGILRADVHVVHSWDVMVEGRALMTGTVDTVDYGLVVGVFRHIGDNVKIGGGYNFGSFSDDLRDQTLDDHGWFLNVLAKF